MPRAYNFDDGVVDCMERMFSVPLRYVDGEKMVSYNPVSYASYDENTKSVKVQLNKQLKDMGIKVEVE